MNDVRNPAMPETSGFTFRHALRVRWSEVDPQGIVFNPQYFVYADVAFTEYQRAIGLPYPAGLHDEGVDLFAVSASARYRAPARYDDELAIGVRAATLGRTSLSCEVVVSAAGATLVEIALTYVTAALATRAPVVLPDRLVRAVLAYERTAPTRKAAT